MRPPGSRVILERPVASPALAERLRRRRMRRCLSAGRYGAGSMKRPVERLVDTPLGPSRVVENRATRPYATLVLGHGAHGGVETRDLIALAENLPREGITVIRIEQPWRVAGKTVAPAAPTLDRGWIAVAQQLRIRGTFVVGGRSAGARVACRTAASLAADAVLAIAFPLHPPGKPERSRADELLTVGMPALVVQGERDAFGRPGELPPGPYRLHVVPDADHGLAVLKRGPVSQDDALRGLISAVRDFVGEIAGR
jgi:uncharacterized protein